MPTKKTPKKPSVVTKSPARKTPAEKPLANNAAAERALDEAVGAAAFKRLRGTLQAMPAAAVSSLRFGARKAALAALGLVQFVEERALRPRLAYLAKGGELDLLHLDRLSDLGQALWYCRAQVDLGDAMRSEALLPAALAEEGTALRRRMLHVLDYRFVDDPTVRPRLDYIRVGTGYEDLAVDLQELAQLYAEHAERLRGMPEFYVAADGARALSVAGQILSQLGLGPRLQKSGARASAQDWSDLQRRAASLLEASYEEVAAACRFLCRTDAAAQARLLPLPSIARARPTSRRGSPEPDAPTPAPERDSPGTPAPR